MSYKALRYTSKKDEGLKTLPIPQSVEGTDLLVKVKYAALNPVDLFLKTATNAINFLGREQGMGREFSGEVVSVGPEEKVLKKGDRIVGWLEVVGDPEGASISQYLVINRKKWLVAKVPEDYPLDKAATLPLSFCTAKTLLSYEPTLGPQSKVLVIGGGTVAGLMVLQLLKNGLGVKDVVSVNSKKTDTLYKEKLDFSVTSVNYETVEPTEGVLEIIRNRFNGEKFDMIIDCVGGCDFLNRASDFLKLNQNKSFLTIVGTKLGDYEGLFFGILNLFGSTFLKSLTTKIFRAGFRYAFVLAQPGDERLEEAVKLAREKKLDPIIDSVFPLAEYKEAYAKLGSHHAKGKILIEL